MNIAIIGAGWFGCHIATELIEKGYKVKLFEKENELFQGASTYNSSRLHLGFHYPRSYITRKHCQMHFEAFKHKYESICEPVNNNFYFISNRDSLLDFETYLQILDATQLKYDVVSPEDLGFEQMEGGLSCHELAINASKAKILFKSLLRDRLVLNKKIEFLEEKNNTISIEGEPFDYVVNATYFNFLPKENTIPILYENVVSLLVKPRNNNYSKSFVIMDGDFFSLNRYYSDNENETLYSLYHVKDSVINSANSYAEVKARDSVLKLKSTDELLNIENLLEKVRFYYPTFENDFELVGHFLSIRTKLLNKNADRACIVNTNGRIINVLSGKISSIFEASEKVFSILEN